MDLHGAAPAKSSLLSAMRTYSGILADPSDGPRRYDVRIGEPRPPILRFSARLRLGHHAAHPASHRNSKLHVVVIEFQMDSSRQGENHHTTTDRRSSTPRTEHAGRERFSCIPGTRSSTPLEPTPEGEALQLATCANGKALRASGSTSHGLPVSLGVPESSGVMRAAGDDPRTIQYDDGKGVKVFRRTSLLVVRLCLWSLCCGFVGCLGAGCWFLCGRLPLPFFWSLQLS